MRALLLCLAMLPAAAAMGGTAWAQGVPAIAPPRAAAPPPGPVVASPNPVPAGTPAIAPVATAPTATPATAAAPEEAAPPRRPRPVARRAPSRPRDPRDRAYMDGGLIPQSGFSGFETRTAAPPRAELAPRPNLDLEGPRAAPGANAPTLMPTLIHPRLPGRSAVQDGGVTQRENRLLQSPAPGARLSVPMSW